LQPLFLRLVVGFVLRAQGLARGIARSHNLIALLSGSPTVQLSIRGLNGEVQRLDRLRDSRDISLLWGDGRDWFGVLR